MNGESANSFNEEVQLDGAKQVLGTAAEKANQVMVLTANTPGVNLREGPSILTKVIHKIMSDTIVIRINNLEGWTEVEIPSGQSKSKTIKGWIFNSYIGSIDE